MKKDKLHVEEVLLKENEKGKGEWCVEDSEKKSSLANFQIPMSLSKETKYALELSKGIRQ